MISYSANLRMLMVCDLRVEATDRRSLLNHPIRYSRKSRLQSTHCGSWFLQSHGLENCRLACYCNGHLRPRPDNPEFTLSALLHLPVNDSRDFTGVKLNYHKTLLRQADRLVSARDSPRSDRHLKRDRFAGLVLHRNRANKTIIAAQPLRGPSFFLIFRR